jgi:hypothetical protein
LTPGHPVISFTHLHLQGYRTELVMWRSKRNKATDVVPDVVPDVVLDYDTPSKADLVNFTSYSHQKGLEGGYERGFTYFKDPFQPDERFTREMYVKKNNIRKFRVATQEMAEMAKHPGAYKLEKDTFHNSNFKEFADLQRLPDKFKTTDPHQVLTSLLSTLSYPRRYAKDLRHPIKVDGECSFDLSRLGGNLLSK